MTDSLLDMDALLDQDMGSVEDIPDYVEPPAGHYNLGIASAEAETYTQKAREATATEAAKAAKECGRIRVTYRVNSTKEVEGDESPVPDGSLFSETFMLTEQGLGFFKKTAKKILKVEEMEGVNVRELLSELATVENFDAMITIRTSDKPGGGVYTNTNVRPVVEDEPAVTGQSAGYGAGAQA